MGFGFAPPISIRAVFVRPFEQCPECDQLLDQLQLIRERETFREERRWGTELYTGVVSSSGNNDVSVLFCLKNL